MKRAIAMLGTVWSLGVQAADMDYGIDPVDLGKGCFGVVGATDYFDMDNGGFVVNTGFIVTDDGVVVIDTGPSKRFGEQLRAAIGRVTDKPINRVLITHMHPDHFLGNQAFIDVPIEAGDVTREDIVRFGQDFTLNMYRLSGDWMRGTEPVEPNAVLKAGVRTIGGHRLRIDRIQGHTHEDFVITDETCGVMYAADALFLDRTPTTPHADLDQWIDAVSTLRFDGVKTIVPGHGPIDREGRSVQQTHTYLVWLKAVLEAAARQGLDITEVMELPLPDRFSTLALARSEFQRTAAYLYPAIELKYFE